MKIICVAYLHGSGGAERQITMLANALCTRGHEVYLAVLAENNRKYEISNGVTVCDLTYAEKKKNRIFQRGKALRKLYEEIQPDVTIHYWLQSTYLTAFMHEDKYGKIIYSERGDPGDSEYNGILGVIRSVAFKEVNGFVFQSEGAQDYFAENIRNRSVVIHNSVELPEGKYLVPCKQREKKIVSVGRLHPQKNQKLLISAFAQIANQFSEYNLEIYGDGALHEELNTLISNYGLENRVFIYATRPDIYDYVYSASLFVLSSDYEGMPNALMEAMALGVPCISTDCRPGGARTLIENGVNGYIVPIGDARALAKSMQQLLENGALAENVASQGILLRKSHSSLLVFDRWNSFISEVSGKNGD